MYGGWDSVISVVIRWRLDHLGFIPPWGQDFLHLSRPALKPS